MPRLSRAVGDYLDEAVYGANDGIITTFAVVAGASGAVLGSSTIIILGIANLIADGFSMGASSYLALRTEEDVAKVNGTPRVEGHALMRSMVTCGAFILAGSMPLVPFLFPFAEGHELLISSLGACGAFFIVGGARSFATRKSFTVSGLEMLMVGGVAALLAYSVGALLRTVVTSM